MRGVIAFLLAALHAASCQPLEQGYWMKPGLTETSQDADYRRDSGECASQGLEQVSMNQTPGGDTIVARHPSASHLGSNLYGRCMVSRGYEWVKLQPLVPPSPHQESANKDRVRQNESLRTLSGIRIHINRIRAHVPARTMSRMKPTWQLLDQRRPPLRPTMSCPGKPPVRRCPA